MQISCVRVTKVPLARIESEINTVVWVEPCETQPLSRMGKLAAVFLLFGAAAVSVVACVWLIIKIYRSNATFRRRLFPTQMGCLAIADIGFVVSAVPVMLMEQEHLLPCSATVLAPTCFFWRPVFNFFRHASLWMEMHIAVGFLLASLRVRAFGPLKCGLHVIWLPSLSLSIFSACVSPWRYDGETCSCRPREWAIGADPASLADFALCMSVCAGCYIAVLLKNLHQRAPESVYVRDALRTDMYIFNALITYGPTFACYCSRPLYHNFTFWTVSGCLECLGGFFNTVTYAWQSRYMKVFTGDPSVMREDPALGPRRLSYSVGFGGTTTEFLSESRTMRSFDVVNEVHSCGLTS